MGSLTLSWNRALVLSMGLLALGGLYLISLRSYLLFHSLAEIFSVVIAGGIFMVTWNSRLFAGNGYFLFLGLSFLFTGGLDLVHTLAYRGMGVFPGAQTNLATQLWIASRYFQAVSFILAFFFLKRKLHVPLALLAGALASALLLLSIFSWKNFPACFIEGAGLTPFKIYSEYAVAALFLLSLALLWRSRREFDPHVLRRLAAGLALAVAAGLMFTLYTDPYGLSNLLGHFFKILFFYFIYRAIVETGLRRPYALLFRNLKQSEERFRVALESSPVAVFHQDRDLRYTWAHSALPEFRAEEMRGKTDFDFFPPQTASLLADWKRLVLQNGTGLRREFTASLAGRERFFDLTVAPLRDERGAIEGITCAAVDITPRKRAEEDLRQAYRDLDLRVQERTAELAGVNEALKEEIRQRQRAEEDLIESNEVLESVFSGIGLLIAYLDRDFNFIRVNRTYARADGREPEFYPGRNHFHLYPQEENEAIFRRVVETGQPYFAVEKPFEYAGNPERGVTYWNWSLHPVRGAGGEVAGVILVMTEVTEHRRAKEALWQTEEMLRKVLETLPIGVWVTDREGKIVMGNPAGKRVWAGARYVGVEDYEEYQGWWAHSGKKIEAEEWALARAIREGQTSLNEEVEIETFDGQRKTILNSAVPLRGAGGEILGAIGVNEDITERRRSVEALREQAALLDLAHDTILVLLLDGTIAFWNHGAEEMYGYSREEAMGRVARELLGTRFPRPFQEILSQVLTEGRWQGELVHTRRDGTRLTAASRWALQRGPRGEPLHILEINSDITARKEAEEAHLRAKEELEARVRERTQALVSANQALHAEVQERQQAEGALKQRLAAEEFLSRVSARFAKTPPDEVEGEIQATLRDLRDFSGADRSYLFLLSPDRKTIESVYESKIPRLKSRAGEFRGLSLESLPWAHEKLRGLEAILVPRLADLPKEAGPEKKIWSAFSLNSLLAIPMALGNSLVGFFGFTSEEPGKTWNEEDLGLLRMVGEVLANVMERKRAEEERRKLEASIQEMQKKEMEARLRENERWTALGQMASGIAHDIRNPINFVSLALDHLSAKTKSKEPKTQKLFEDSHAELMRVSKMIQDLLEFGRARTLHLEVEDGARILARSLEETFRLRPAQKARVLPEGTGGSFPVRVERDLLLRALLNLLENALDAGGPEGAVRTGIGFRPPHRDEIVLWVEDSGPGIPPENLDKIFTPYFTTKKSGIGMGLTLVQKWVKEMEGTIQAYNLTGGGARFEISFPAVQGTPSGG